MIRIAENIVVNDDKCFSCGTKEGLTTHHILPQTLKPQRNILIKLCKGCHKKIHVIDKSTTIAFLTRLIKKSQELQAQMKECINAINGDLDG